MKCRQSMTFLAVRADDILNLPLAYYLRIFLPLYVIIEGMCGETLHG